MGRTAIGGRGRKAGDKLGEEGEHGRSVCSKGGGMGVSQMPWARTGRTDASVVGLTFRAGADDYKWGVIKDRL